MKPKRSATRRSFLRAVGAGAVALPFYRLLEDHFAKAYGETLPLRFIGVYHPHGIAAEYFAMQYSGNPFPNGPVSTTPEARSTTAPSTRRSTRQRADRPASSWRAARR